MRERERENEYHTKFQKLHCIEGVNLTGIGKIKDLDECLTLKSGDIVLLLMLLFNTIFVYPNISCFIKFCHMSSTITLIFCRVNTVSILHHCACSMIVIS